ncbi:MAG: ribosome recycling factor [Anaerovoracaceae bacterium]
MIEDVILRLEEKTEKSLKVLKEEFNGVRAGRANPALLDKVEVEYYGVPSPLKNIANISVPDPRTLVIAPFDPKSIPDIEKALNVADIGITPANDGKIIRLSIPQVTEERRKELTKIVRKMGEEDKVAIRNLRREANEELKKEEKNGDLTEDDLKAGLHEVQEHVDKAIKNIDEMIANKEKEIMEV